MLFRTAVLNIETFSSSPAGRHWKQRTPRWVSWTAAIEPRIPAAEHWVDDVWQARLSFVGCTSSTERERVVRCVWLYVCPLLPLPISYTCRLPTVVTFHRHARTTTGLDSSPVVVRACLWNVTTVGRWTSVECWLLSPYNKREYTWPSDATSGHAPPAFSYHSFIYGIAMRGRTSVSANEVPSHWNRVQDSRSSSSSNIANCLRRRQNSNIVAGMLFFITSHFLVCEMRWVQY